MEQEREQDLQQPLDASSVSDDVVACYGAMVYRLAYARLQNRHDADDIFQEVFLRYVRRGPVFASYEHGKAWFLRVTINCCKNFWMSLGAAEPQPGQKCRRNGCGMRMRKRRHWPRGWLSCR